MIGRSPPHKAFFPVRIFPGKEFRQKKSYEYIVNMYNEGRVRESYLRSHPMSPTSRSQKTARIPKTSNRRPPPHKNKSWTFLLGTSTSVYFLEASPEVLPKVFSSGRYRGSFSSETTLLFCPRLGVSRKRSWFPSPLIFAPTSSFPYSSSMIHFD